LLSVIILDYYIITVSLIGMMLTMLLPPLQLLL